MEESSSMVVVVDAAGLAVEVEAGMGVAVQLASVDFGPATSMR